jgi:hypothetical protein
MVQIRCTIALLAGMFIITATMLVFAVNSGPVVSKNTAGLCGGNENCEVAQSQLQSVDSGKTPTPAPLRSNLASSTEPMSATPCEQSVYLHVKTDRPMEIEVGWASAE